METFGFEETTKTRVYKVLAAILQLGNIEFEDTNDSTSTISATSHTACEDAAILLSVAPSVLRSNLLNRIIQVGSVHIR